MQKITDHINSVLQDGILKAYAAGIKSVVEKNKKTILKIGKEPVFNKYDDFQPSGKIKKIISKKGKESPVFSIDYTAEDLEAIRNFRVEAFTVATIGDYELQDKLKELAINTVREKQSDIEYFTKEARRISDRYVRGDWLKTNLTTATSSSYRAAEWIRLQDPDVKDIYPAYQYKTRQDSRVRDEHRKLANKVFRNHDPILKSIYPPNGWNCRCYVIPLDQDEIGSGQYKIENELRNESETKQLLKDAFPNPKDAKNFMRNPGESKSIWKKWINEKLAGFDGQVKEEIKGKVKEYARGVRDELTSKKVIPVKVPPSQGEITYGQSKNIPSNLPDHLKDEIPDFAYDAIPDTTKYTFKKTGGSHVKLDNSEIVLVNHWGHYKDTPKEVLSKIAKHEVSHSVHLKSILKRRPDYYIDPSVDEYFNKIRTVIEDKLKSRADLVNKYSSSTTRDFVDDSRNISNIEKTYDKTSVADIIASITNAKYGYGHKKSYYRSHEFYRVAEVLANTGEMYLTELKTGKINPHLAKDFPELTKEIKLFWSNYYAKNK